MQEKDKIEIWKPVPEVHGIYEVSDWGRVRRAACPHCRTKPRLVTPCLDGSGYFQVGLSYGGRKPIRRKVHRLIMAAFHGADPRWVNHIDGNPSNNHLENLEYVTPRENALHKSRVLGRWGGPAGNKNHKALDLDVAAILEMKAQGMSNRAIARELDLKCHKVIGVVVNRRHWSQR
jgi:hypothetical protein